MRRLHGCFSACHSACTAEPVLASHSHKKSAAGYCTCTRLQNRQAEDAAQRPPFKRWVAEEIIERQFQ